MSKQFWAMLAIVAVLLGGIFLFTRDQDASAPDAKAQPTKNVTGAGTKGVTLVEYGDYQCPYCIGYHPVVKQVVEKYGDDITFQFRNLPLSSIHQNAFAGARAAQAAGLQNKFWEMHDKIYENADPNGQSGWVASSNPLAFFETYAKDLKLDVTKFKKDFASSNVNSMINADLAAFEKTKQPQSTPTFFLNGKLVDPNTLTLNSQPTLEQFSKVIDDAIASQNKQ